MPIINLVYEAPTPRPELCFTANTANSTVQLKKYWTPTEVTLETSTDWTTWNTYTFDTDITLANIWDRVYFRNTSETDTLFTTNYGGSNSYRFIMTGSIAWSWDVSYLLNKNWTDTLGWNNIFAWLFNNCTSLTTPPELKFLTLTAHCYYAMFNGCTSLTRCPSIPATTLGDYCCYCMFYGCSNLETLPALYSLDLKSNCYAWMFSHCSKIKISESQTWEYQTEYRIPITWTWTASWQTPLSDIFNTTWWTYTSNPIRNRTYYTSNTVV